MRISGTDAGTSVLQNNPAIPGVSNASTPGTQKTNVPENQPQQRSDTDKSDKPLDEKAVSEAVSKINKLLEGTSRSVSISVHEKTHEIMVKVIDDETGKVIREVPPKKILDMIANMMEMAGLIVDERR